MLRSTSIINEENLISHFISVESRKICKLSPALAFSTKLDSANWIVDFLSL